VCDWAPAVRLCCDFFGVDRVMHGTDHPFWPMPLGSRLLDQVELGAKERAKIEHENAERIFQIEVTARERG
jgi:predicted TIM-barrel fold metal-dependent hydrolase